MKENTGTQTDFKYNTNRTQTTRTSYCIKGIVKAKKRADALQTRT